MVNIDIPPHYTGSPSSHVGTPHLTINREATVDLDSTNAFEGPEKLLEVWFSASATALPASASPLGLKTVSADLWKEMLDLVNCKVLSVVESDDVDAYLLSESSMFVFPHKLVLKTCGTTTLLYGLPRMLELAATEAGFPHVQANVKLGTPAAATPYRVFYSRKNFLHPEQQRGPHRSWRDEVRFLDKMFAGGSAYMIGKMNGEHWYLYITAPNNELTPPATPENERLDIVETQTQILDLPDKMAQMAMNPSQQPQDETLEILMTDLDEANARQFYLDEAARIAEGNYRRRALEARKSAIDHLGVIPEANHSNPSISGKTLVEGLSGTEPIDLSASAVSGFSSEDENEPLTFPEELTTEGHTLGSVVSDACGLSDVYPTAKYPDARIDAYLFTPCGFSANGVVPAPAPAADGGSTHYFTVHVTPEPHCSYASFETNVPAAQTGRETADVVRQVVNIFKPGRFSVTLFEAKDEDDGGKGKRDKRMEALQGYRRVDRIVHDLEGYELVFRYYEREDWKGGAPRLGESY
ncbi:spermidine resistance protein [Zalaria obscura]|uniref:Spermidine resistance protein n=1 Tax=Zalaria obscura TaxID=2024903 RepID=A0ACC3SE72_9PEZI